ncbi:hypothetical protein DSO57_1006882 [Entomophthora muscae]|uniref:Uncharacterized protein n=1 Tax=Entomophthora muscae TaxID=34485 RepID=A0ACC2T7F2_9FUNG|nr:hypothetical protein DSO57_1006882 [Entomophthora muscae]
MLLFTFFITCILAMQWYELTPHYIHATRDHPDHRCAVFKRKPILGLGKKTEDLPPTWILEKACDTTRCFRYTICVPKTEIGARIGCYYPNCHAAAIINPYFEDMDGEIVLRNKVLHKM